VHRRHMPEPARGGERELPGAGTKIDDGGGLVQAMRLEGGHVFGWIGIPLLAVIARHECRVEVFGSRMRQFVDHPLVGHVGSACSRATVLRLLQSRSTGTV